jgi:hypothetical protein
MAFLSNLWDVKVTDMDSNAIGKLNDLIARERPGFTPPVDAIIVEADHQKETYHFLQLSHCGPRYRLKTSIGSTPTYELTDDDVSLADVLDTDH